MAEAALVALRAVVFVVEFAANLFGGLGLDNLALDRVREKAVEAILAVSHVEVDAGIEASIHMKFAAFRLGLSRPRAFIHSEVLVGAQVLDSLKLLF